MDLKPLKDGLKAIYGRTAVSRYELRKMAFPRILISGGKRALMNAVNERQKRTAIALGRQESSAFLHFSEC
jgi:hypothetical protein